MGIGRKTGKLAKTVLSDRGSALWIAWLLGAAAVMLMFWGAMKLANDLTMIEPAQEKSCSDRHKSDRGSWL